MANRSHRNLMAAAERATGWRSRPRYSLPPDLVDESIRRVGVIALVAAVLFSAGLILSAALTGVSDLFPMTWSTALGRGTAALLSLATFLIIRRPGISNRVKADAGLAYEVFLALSIAFTEMTILRDMGIDVGWVSLVVVWIFLMRMLVPTTTLRASVAAGLSAATIPLSMELATLAGYPPVGDWVYAANLKSAFGAAVMAVLASRVVYGLGARVSEARELGSYRLEELLGKGGMGEVWRASHRMLKRSAAIKIVSPEVFEAAPGDSAGLVNRFEQEALAIARLRSTHTVTLFDFGRADDGSFYYVMELLEGLDLKELVTRYGPQPSERTVHILAQVCHSLGEAHGMGLVHRDVKPSNIFLCRLGPDYDFVKVLDFGLVKETATDSAGPGLTRDGVATGTPAFMPPEVALASVEPGPYTDIYMLGCVGYWLLTGDLVFTGETPVSIISQHIYAEPQPLSGRTELAVPAGLEQLIMDCLAKDPAGRPQSTDDVARRLAACTLEAAWSTPRAAAWWDHHHPVGPGGSVDDPQSG